MRCQNRESKRSCPLSRQREDRLFDAYINIVFSLQKRQISTARTTIDISDELLRQAKKKAADEGVPLRQVVESALRVYLGKQPMESGYQLRWRTERGRLLPGIRLDDRDALFDVMDAVMDGRR